MFSQALGIYKWKNKQATGDIFSLSCVLVISLAHSFY